MFVIYLFFIHFHSFVNGAFSHTETDKALHCVEHQLLVKPAISLTDPCICRHNWTLNEYNYIDAEGIIEGGEECSEQLTGCDHNCLGGGWCPVANPNCVTREERQIMTTKCDSFTPVTGDCEELYCGCNAHLDCHGAQYCSNDCVKDPTRGECQKTATNWCQPCDACTSSNSFDSDDSCLQHCASQQTTEFRTEYSYENTVALLTTEDKENFLRMECFELCMQDEQCYKERETPDTFLFIYPHESFCMYGVSCSKFYGTTRPQMYPDLEAEHWRVITNNADARQYQCDTSHECEGFQDYANCCTDIFNTVSVCSRKESVHCTAPVGACVDGEHYCDTYKGDLVCVPDAISCKHHYKLYTPIMGILGIIVIAMLKRYGIFDQLQWYAAMESDDEDEGSFFTSYSRDGFVNGTVRVPIDHRPSWKFSYDNEDKCLLFDNLASSCLAGSIPGGIQLGILTFLISWFRAYSSLKHAPSWFLEENAIVGFIHALHDITQTMQTFVSVLLVFVLINRLNWFFSVLGNMYRVQGSIASFAMFVGTRIKDRDVLFRVYRFLNLIHVFLHTRTTEHLSKEISYDELERCKLLLPYEALSLKQTFKQEGGRRNLVLKWLGEIVANEFHGDDKIQLEREYSELRNNAMFTIKCINQTIPYSLIQLVLFLTYFWLALMPFAMYHKMTRDQVWVSVTMFAPLSTFCVSLCFQTILSIILAISNPTGKDLDDVDPEALLIETDEALLVFLGGQEDGEGKMGIINQSSFYNPAISEMTSMSLTGVSKRIDEHVKSDDTSTAKANKNVDNFSEGIEMQEQKNSAQTANDVAPMQSHKKIESGSSGGGVPSMSLKLLLDRDNRAYPLM